MKTCTYPMTGLRCVSRIYTDLAVLDVGPTGLRLREAVGGMTLDGLRAHSGVPIEA